MHAVDPDPELVTMSEDELKVWGFLMTQYNLKSSLQKFGAEEVTMAIDNLTQLHVMDTWMAMDPSKLAREDLVKVLSSLLFLKEKQTTKINGQV
jgi:hypothetical protein